MSNSTSPDVSIVEPRFQAVYVEKMLKQQSFVRRSGFTVGVIASALFAVTMFVAPNVLGVLHAVFFVGLTAIRFYTCAFQTVHKQTSS